MSKIRWGIVGPGKIAAQFAHDLGLIANAELSAVASRSLKRATAFAQDFDIAHVFGSYDELFMSQEVDIVYIATPHVFHYELAIQAMKHGKHVLCEKPLGINAEEVNEMLECSTQHQVFLMEALWSRFNPTLKMIKEKVDQGILGTIRYINADFAFYALDRSKESRLLNTALAGGSLLDIGIYPVFLSYLLMGLPKEILATANVDENGLETQVAMLFDYGACKAILYSGLTNNSRMSAEIAGEKGNIYIDPRWHEPDGFTIQTVGDEQYIKMPKKGKGYTYEIEEVHQCLNSGQLESKLWSHQNSRDLIQLLDKVRSLTGIHFPDKKQ